MKVFSHIILLILLCNAINAQQPSSPSLTDFCDDGGFESKNMNNWGWEMRGYLRAIPDNSGIYSSFTGNSPSINGAGTNASLTTTGGSPYIGSTTFNWQIVTTSTDPIVPINTTLSGNKALKMGLYQPGFAINGVESIKKSIVVNSENATLKFSFALVFESGHTNTNHSSFFGVKVNGTYIPVLPSYGPPNVPIFQYDNQPFIKFQANPLGGGTYYTDWNCAYLDLSDYNGQTVSIEFINSDCSEQSHFSYTYLDDICFEDACVGSNFGSIKLTSNCPNIIGNYSLPFTTTATGTLNSIKLYPYKNGKKIYNASAFDVISTSINTTTKSFSIPVSVLANYWSTLNEFDVVAFSEFSLANSNTTPASSTIYSVQSNLRGFYMGYNNDIFGLKNYIVDSQIFIKEECEVKVKSTYPFFSYNSSNKCRIEPCEFRSLIDNFNFDRGFYNYPNNLSGYYFHKRDSFYDCNTDIKWYQIQYRCISSCDTFFFTIKISTDCNIVLCDKLICGSDAGKVLNPFLSNLKGAIRPDKTYTYNTKRIDLPNNNLRKGEYFKDFTPLFATNTWTQSSDINWINSKQVTLYNHKGNEIESRNPFNIYSATRFGFNHSLPIAVASNSKYRNFISWGFDDEEYLEYSCSKTTSLDIEKYTLPIISTNGVYDRGIMDQSFNILEANSSYEESHTGNYSYKVVPIFSNLNNYNAYQAGENNFLSKVIPLCGPGDPNYNDPTYAINSTIPAQSVQNSYAAKFNLEKGKKYILSYWVKNAAIPSYAPNNVVFGEALGYMKIYKNCDTNYIRESYPKSGLIEGWKQMTQVFEVENTTNLVKLVFFPFLFGSYYDDIRIFPYDANMKSFVYHPRSLKLTAELDENNYATFYDYDEEGNLVRIRKETDRGIMSIKEQRNVLKTTK